MRRLVLLLSAAMFLHFSCEDSRVEEKLEESIEETIGKLHKRKEKIVYISPVKNCKMYHLFIYAKN